MTRPESQGKKHGRKRGPLSLKPQVPSPPPVPHPHTCGRYPVLLLFELAHVDQVGRPLYLSAKDLQQEALRRHLQEDQCEVCLRWYRNACRVYERLPADDAGHSPDAGCA